MTTWNTYIEALQEYSGANKVTRIPSQVVVQHNGEEIRLGAWTSNVRLRARQGELGQTQRDDIERAVPGFEWGPFKPGPQANVDRKEQVYRLRDQNLSLSAIGKQVGVTRQRVHQILAERS